jgi:cytochrome c5
MIMGKKLSLWVLGAIGLLALVYGCQNMAVQMSKGQMLYRAKCSSCHNIIEPSRHDQQTWDVYVEKYGQIMTVEEKQAVLQYLVDSD